MVMAVPFIHRVLVVILITIEWSALPITTVKYAVQGEQSIKRFRTFRSFLMGHGHHLITADADNNLYLIESLPFNINQMAYNEANRAVFVASDRPHKCIYLICPFSVSSVSVFQKSTGTISSMAIAKGPRTSTPDRDFLYWLNVDSATIEMAPLTDGGKQKRAILSLTYRVPLQMSISTGGDYIFLLYKLKMHETKRFVALLDNTVALSFNREVLLKRSATCDRDIRLLANNDKDTIVWYDQTERTIVNTSLAVGQGGKLNVTDGNRIVHNDIPVLSTIAYDRTSYLTVTEDRRHIETRRITDFTIERSVDFAGLEPFLRSASELVVLQNTELRLADRVERECVSSICAFDRVDGRFRAVQGNAAVCVQDFAVHRCHCPVGQTLSVNGIECTPIAGPTYAFVAQPWGIEQHNLHTDEMSIVWSPPNAAVVRSFAVELARDRIIVLLEDVAKVYQLTLADSQVVVLSNTGLPRDVALDVANGNVYVLSAIVGLDWSVVHVCNFNSRACLETVREEHFRVSFIALDAFSRFLFLANSTHVYRTHLNGTVIGQQSRQLSSPIMAIGCDAIHKTLYVVSSDAAQIDILYDYHWAAVVKFPSARLRAFDFLDAQLYVLEANSTSLSACSVLGECRQLSNRLSVQLGHATAIRLSHDRHGETTSTATLQCSAHDCPVQCILTDDLAEAADSGGCDWGTSFWSRFAPKFSSSAEVARAAQPLLAHFRPWIGVVFGVTALLVASILGALCAIVRRQNRSDCRELLLVSPANVEHYFLTTTF